MKPSYLAILILLLSLSACSTPFRINPTPVVQETLVEIETSAPVQPSPIITCTETIVPSETQLPTVTSTLAIPTMTSTPWDLNYFIASDMKKGVVPIPYVDDTCEYLENRWSNGKSKPGTIVVPIMFHSIAKPGYEALETTTISRVYFEYFMKEAKRMGFETITASELAGFLLNNDPIPERSMILILDDRRPGVTELFMPYLEANDWTLTLAWPTTDNTNAELWSRMEKLAETGLLDFQSHGHNHIYIQDFTDVEVIEEEITQPIEVIESHFGAPPSALIWPGGNFTKAAVDFARQTGYQLGFTVYSRGPLMYNWIPLGVEEIEVDDPLMVLPRYWSTTAQMALLEAITVSEEAKLNAEIMKEEELNFYSMYCQSAEGD